MPDMIKKNTSSQSPSTTHPAVKDKSAAPKATQPAKTNPAQSTSENDLKSAIAPNQELKLTLPLAKVAPVYQQVMQTAASRLKIDGFRLGKAPLAIAKAKLDPAQLLEKTLTKLLPEYYQAEITKQKITPISEPEFLPVKLNLDQDWEVTAILATQPTIKLAGYQKIASRAKKAAQQTLTETAASKAKKPTQPAKTDSQEKLATSEPPKELTAAQRDDLLTQAIIKELVKEIKPTVPEILIKQQTRQELENFVSRLKQLNVDLDQYLTAQNLSYDQLTTQLAINSLSHLQVDFLLQAIAQEAKITVSEEEITQKITDLTPEKNRASLVKNDHYRHYLESIIRQQKTISHLLSL